MRTLHPQDREGLKDLLIFVGICVGLLIVALTAGGCKSVTIPDSQWCIDMGGQGGACFKTLSSGEVDIPQPQWDIQRPGMICTQSSTFASWKGIIEKLCHESSDCDYPSVSAFLDRASATKANP